MPPHAQPFSLVSMNKQKSSCCYEVLHSTNPITDLSAVCAQCLAAARSQPDGLCGKECLVRFHKNGLRLRAGHFNEGMPNLGNISRAQKDSTRPSLNRGHA
jgi:hypothetical protein